MTKEWVCFNIEELQNIAFELLASHSQERVFAFVGAMGAGKTTFIKSLCKSLGVSEEVSSPTFSLVNEYEAKDQSTIYHFDFYRIESETEAYDIGLEEYLDSGNYCFIEWPNKIDSLLPENFVLINIKEINGEREIKAELILD